MLTSGNGEIILQIPAISGLAVKVQIEVLPSPAWTPSIKRSRFIYGVNDDSYYPLTNSGISQSVNIITNIALVAGQTIALWVSTVRTSDGTESLPVLRTTVVSL
jgi:hypothetical protein